MSYSTANQWNNRTLAGFVQTVQFLLVNMCVYLTNTVDGGELMFIFCKLHVHLP